jgi:hypothetical protein
VNAAVLALSNANALRSYPTLLGEALSLWSAALDTHLLGCLHPGLLIGCNEVLFW